METISSADASKSDSTRRVIATNEVASNHTNKMQCIIEEQRTSRSYFNGFNSHRSFEIQCTWLDTKRCTRSWCDAFGPHRWCCRSTTFSSTAAHHLSGVIMILPENHFPFPLCRLFLFDFICARHSDLPNYKENAFVRLDFPSSLPSQKGMLW